MRVHEKRGDLWVIELPEPALSFFERFGQMPLPPYIRREPDASDARRYQSVFARRHGAVAQLDLVDDYPALQGIAAPAFAGGHLGDAGVVGTFASSSGSKS